MAAYIELNPVRAGIVGDPVDYAFCGWAEAALGRLFPTESTSRSARPPFVGELHNVTKKVDDEQAQIGPATTPPCKLCGGALRSES